MKLQPKQRGRPRDESLPARRHEEILDVAARLFAQHGYGLDVQMVADDLGLGKGTIYRYFPAKRDLFLAAVDRGMQRLAAAVDAAAARVNEPLETIVAAIRAYLSFFREHPHYIELLMLERAEFKDRTQPTYFLHRERNMVKWERLVGALIAAGRLRPVSGGVINVVGDLLYGAMFTTYFTGRTQSVDEQAAAILDLIFHGVLSDTERARVLRQPLSYTTSADQLSSEVGT